MQLAGKITVHQIHPAKIGADVTASVVSNVLLWQGRPKAALAVRVVLPVAGSLAVLMLADLDALATTAPGRYVLAKMPLSAQVVRLAGDAVMGLGARRRSVALLLAARPSSGSAGHMRRGRDDRREGDNRILNDSHCGK